MLLQYYLLSFFLSLFCNYSSIIFLCSLFSFFPVHCNFSLLESFFIILFFIFFISLISSFLSLKLLSIQQFFTLILSLFLSFNQYFNHSFFFLCLASCKHLLLSVICFFVASIFFPFFIYYFWILSNRFSNPAYVFFFHLHCWNSFYYFLLTFNLHSFFLSFHYICLTCGKFKNKTDGCIIWLTFLFTHFFPSESSLIL